MTPKPIEIVIDAGMVFRLFTLMTHYRQPLNYTEQRMAEAQKILMRWWRVAEPTDEEPPVEVLEALMDDINTPKAIAAMHKYRGAGEGKKLFAAMRFLGLVDGRSFPDDWRTVPRDQQMSGPFEGPDTPRALPT